MELKDQFESTRPCAISSGTRDTKPPKDDTKLTHRELQWPTEPKRLVVHKLQRHTEHKVAHKRSKIER